MWRQFIYIVEDIKLSHSLFAIPFALSVLFLYPSSLPSPWVWLFLLLCLVFARSFAMAVNRIIDDPYDRRNSRTARRALGSLRVSKYVYVFFTFVCAAMFIVSSFALSQNAGVLSVPLLVVLGLYPLGKQYSFLVHFYLGLCLALSPLAVAVALDFSLSWPLGFLCLGILFWVAGFDIIYAFADQKIDQELGLKSIPSYLGLVWSKWIVFLSYLLSLSSFVIAGVGFGNGWLYFGGLFVIGAILAYEIYLMSYDRKQSIMLNASISVVFLASVIADYFWQLL
jgi:4-hydroxybenzoate polyprenyltransferase